MPKIFCCNAGRSGSKFIARSFSLLSKVPTFHEPIPWCVGETCREVNDADDLLSETTRRVLYEKIKFIIENSDEDGNYLETSQMFIKSFVDTVLLNFQDVYCIYLHRDINDVLLSYYRRCWHRELDWFLQPHWKANILRKEGKFSFMDIVEWNWYEVKARYEAYKPRFAKTWDFDFKDINNLDEYYRMFDHFGIEYRKIKKLPDRRSEHTNILTRKEVLHPDKSEGELRKEMKKNWHLPGMKKWRFPSDMKQLQNQR